MQLGTRGTRPLFLCNSPSAGECELTATSHSWVEGRPPPSGEPGSGHLVLQRAHVLGAEEMPAPLIKSMRTPHLCSPPAGGTTPELRKGLPQETADSGLTSQHSKLIPASSGLVLLLVKAREAAALMEPWPLEHAAGTERGELSPTLP